VERPAGSEVLHHADAGQKPQGKVASQFAQLEVELRNQGKTASKPNPSADLDHSQVLVTGLRFQKSSRWPWTLDFYRSKVMSDAPRYS